jgi:hypothetical protein
MLAETLQIGIGIVALVVGLALVVQPKFIFDLSDKLNLPTSQERGYDRDSPEYQRTQHVLRVAVPAFALIMAAVLLLRGFHIV